MRRTIAAPLFLFLALSALGAGPLRAQVVYLDSAPGEVERMARTEEGAAKLYDTLSKMDTGRAPLAEVPRLAPRGAGDLKPIRGDSIQALLAEYQSRTVGEARFSDITRALSRVYKGGRVDYADLKDSRKAAVYTTAESEAGGTKERVLVSERLKSHSLRPAHRWVVSSLLAHEGYHALRPDSDAFEEEVGAHRAQCDYLARDRERLDSGAREAVSDGDPAVLKLYLHSVDLLAACDRGELRKFVRARYSDEDLH